jgi:hypothetical protein
VASRTNLLVDLLLQLLELVLNLLQLRSVWRRTIGLEDLDITVVERNGQRRIRLQIPPPSSSHGAAPGKVEGNTYSSDNGTIFFSSTSSSANFLVYFSQLLPVALGMAGRVRGM